jgi:hypothetical protein
MGKLKIMEECFLCRRSFQFGPNLYEGRYIGAWGISVCLGCSRSPWDEVPPVYTQRVREHLQAKGIPYELNASGWIKWP